MRMTGEGDIGLLSVGGRTVLRIAYRCQVSILHCGRRPRRCHRSAIRRRRCTGEQYSLFLVVVILTPRPALQHIKVIRLEPFIAPCARKASPMPLALQLPVTRAHGRLFDRQSALATRREIHFLPVPLAEHYAVAFDKALGPTDGFGAFDAYLWSSAGVGRGG
jgi:hypothetical protein